MTVLLCSAVASRAVPTEVIRGASDLVLSLVFFCVSSSPLVRAILAPSTKCRLPTWVAGAGGCFGWQAHLRAWFCRKNMPHARHV